MRSSTRVTIGESRIKFLKSFLRGTKEPFIKRTDTCFSSLPRYLRQLEKVKKNPNIAIPKTWDLGYGP